jgi:Fe2+ or Zn2+ uptake regulation protein
MICGGCGAALEAHVCEVPVALKKLADGAAFKITRWQTELHGVCAECAA